MAQTSTMESMTRPQHNQMGRGHWEGDITSRIERQTARVPSIGYLGLAVGSMVASALLAIFANRKEFANFVGLWAPSFLLIGIYNKLVKIEGTGSPRSSAMSGGMSTPGSSAVR